MVRDNTTPRPMRHYTSWTERDPDATPAWINDEVRKMGSRAKRTSPLKPTDPPPPLHPVQPTETIRMLAVCWDCGGSGKTGAILHFCPVCGVGYTWEQIEAHGSRDGWGKRIMPFCQHPVPSSSIKRRAELCPTCYDQPVRGHIVMERTWGELAESLVEHVRLNLGITEHDLPTQKAFIASEPTAPAPHLPAGTLTPHVAPLAPHELHEPPKEF